MAASDVTLSPPQCIPGGIKECTSEGMRGNAAPRGPLEGPRVRFGVTDPISLRLPTSKDVYLTERLIEMMRAQNLYETPSGEAKRKAVLEALNRLLNDWVIDVALECASSEVIDELSARRQSGIPCDVALLLPFGSYQLGVVQPDGDIDAVCVVPVYIRREAFFDSFASKLKQYPNVAKVQPVPDAFTPIIKLEFDGIDIDLLFARLSTTTMPAGGPQSLSDDHVLKNVDEKTVRSLNGRRVAEELLRLVPQRDSFIAALRFIKYWARQRGVYSNTLGYLGGVAWALLVARVCQLYPYASASQLVAKFFLCYSQWDWTNPVLLCPIKNHTEEPGLLGFQVWNPKVNVQDRLHLLPVITPAFPSMNSTHNVTLSTRAVLISEFQRGLEKMNLLRKGHLSWSDVVRPVDFFGTAHHFLELKILGSDEVSYGRWKGFVESKLRLLVRKFDQLPGVSVRIYPEAVSINRKEETETKQTGEDQGELHGNGSISLPLPSGATVISATTQAATSAVPVAQTAKSEEMFRYRCAYFLALSIDSSFENYEDFDESDYYGAEEASDSKGGKEDYSMDGDESSLHSAESTNATTSSLSSRKRAIDETRESELPVTTVRSAANTENILDATYHTRKRLRLPSTSDSPSEVDESTSSVVAGSTAAPISSNEHYGYNAQSQIPKRLLDFFSDVMNGNLQGSTDAAAAAASTTTVESAATVQKSGESVTHQNNSADESHSIVNEEKEMSEPSPNGALNLNPDSAMSGSSEAVVETEPEEDFDVDLTGPLLEFVQLLTVGWHEFEAYKDVVDLRISHYRKDELPEYVHHFRAAILRVTAQPNNRAQIASEDYVG